MLFAWIFRVVIIFAILTAIYIGLSLYHRWAERRRLANEFASARQEGPSSPADEAAFIARGMGDYERSLRKKLLLGVYLIPLGAIVLLVALAQL
jgi:uncharacterized iron-regulated membrane protein